MSSEVRRDLEQVILCDMCTDKERKPAHKTCMKCEISMCVQHLQAHLTTPVLLQTHPLTEPMSSGSGGLAGVSKCPVHGKLLEYYCLDDLTCVCVSCAIEDQHRLHNMKTFPTAHKEFMEKVRAEQQALMIKSHNESVNLEKWERSEREKLDRKRFHLIETVSELSNLVLTSVQSSVSARIVPIKTSRSSLQAARNEEDTFRFLQMYSQVHQDLEKAKAVDLRRGLEPSDRDKLVQEIKQKGENIFEQASHFWRSLLTHVDPENHQELGPISSDAVFEPLCFGPGMSLSKDKRKVFCSGWQGKKTSFTFLIQGTQSTSDPNLHRWVISLSDDCDWTLGVCDQNYANGIKNGHEDVNGLCWKGNHFYSLTTQHHQSHSFRGRGGSQNQRRTAYSEVLNPNEGDEAKQTSQPGTIEVVWSNPDLSFYSVISQHQKRHILTIKVNTGINLLSHFVCVEMEESKPSSVRSRGREVSALQHHWRRQWKCTCGRVGAWNIDPNSYRKYDYPVSPSQTCVCGKNIGLSHNTELLCELV